MADVAARRVVVLGSLNMDLVVDVGRLPTPGETVSGTGFRTAGGGKGGNQAIAAARVGASVSMVGCVGDDANGRTLTALLQADGIDSDGVRSVAGPTGVAMVMVDQTGQNFIAVVPASNGHLSPADVSAASARIAAADVLVAQLEVPLATVAAAERAADAGATAFILNAAPALPLPDELLRGVDVLVVNETELGIVAGHQVEAGREAHLARMLLGRGPRAVVVTLGARGALIVDQAGVAAVAPFAVQPVDTTAAGDAFVGALAARYAGPGSLRDAARYASAAAALACTRAGAQPSLPTAAEVERLLAGA